MSGALIIRYAGNPLLKAEGTASPSVHSILSGFHSR